MDYDEAFDFFMRSLWKIQKSIVPLYWMDVTNHRLGLVGTSVYCKHGPFFLLLTAGHVLKTILPAQAWYPYSTEESKPLPSQRYTYPADEADDTGVIVLHSQLPFWNPIPSEEFSTFNESNYYQHILVGYPASLTKGSTRRNQRLEIRGYLTTAAPAEAYSRLEADKSREFVVEFRKEKVYERNMQLTTFPNPNGMSGGPVLQFHENNPNAQSIVGIMTRWDANRRKDIVATRVETITTKFHVVGPE